MLTEYDCRELWQAFRENLPDKARPLTHLYKATIDIMGQKPFKTPGHIGPMDVKQLRRRRRCISFGV
jgi:hypothetical protein